MPFLEVLDAIVAFENLLFIHSQTHHSMTFIDKYNYDATIINKTFNHVKMKIFHRQKQPEGKILL